MEYPVLLYYFLVLTWKAVLWTAKLLYTFEYLKAFQYMNYLIHRNVYVYAVLSTIYKITSFVLIWTYRILRKVILNKLPIAVYLVGLDHFDTRHYKVAGSRGIFDAIVCLCLFYILSYSMYSITEDTYQFKAECIQQKIPRRTQAKII
ncbi:hypothetical protein NEOKW01_1620 [Nematocida sp. AWRm80]|nr:hypothetical protein NEOKW01_1620 [Nematocida sp. AWRm80]